MSLYAVIKQLEGALGGTQAEAVIEYVRVSAQEHSIDMVSRIDEKIAARYAHVDKRMAETATQIELRFAERLDKSLAEVRREMAEGLAEVRREMTERLAEVRREMAGQLAAVRKEMGEGLAEVRAETKDLRSLIAASHVSMIRWVVSTITIQALFFVALAWAQKHLF